MSLHILMRLGESDVVAYVEKISARQIEHIRALDKGRAGCEYSEDLFIDK